MRSYIAILVVLLVTAELGVMIQARKNRGRKKGPLARMACHKLPENSVCGAISSRVSFYTGEKRVLNRLKGIGLDESSAKCNKRLYSLVCKLVYHRCDKLSGPKAARQRKLRLRKRLSKLLKRMCPRVMATCNGSLNKFPVTCRR